MPIYPNRNAPIRNINNTLYIIQAILPIESFSTVRIEDMKDYLGSDTAFRVGKEGVYYFCTEIEEAQIEEIE